jgi:hypothetical protein
MGATEGEHGCDHSTDGTPAKKPEPVFALSYLPQCGSGNSVVCWTGDGEKIRKRRLTVGVGFRKTSEVANHKLPGTYNKR